MAFPCLRPPRMPQCSVCLRSHAWAGFADAFGAPMRPNALRQQLRGKKKAAKQSGSVPARLSKDVPGFGRAGSIVPINRGELRSYYFPKGIARYVTLPELRRLRRDSIQIERDYGFGKEDALPTAAASTATALPEAPVVYETRAAEVEKLTAQRSMEILDNFVARRLDFYRQPIMEEKTEEPARADEKEDKKKRRTASSAAADLLAARSYVSAAERAKPKMTGAIYGSVSPHDILVAIRAAMASNDEAARVLISESDIHFLDQEQKAENKIKATGDFTVEIRIKGADVGIERTVRVIAQKEEDIGKHRSKS